MSKSKIFFSLFLVTYVVVVYYCCHRKKRKTRTKLVVSFNNQNISIMKLNKQKFAEAVLALINADTKEPIEASITNITIESSDTSVIEVRDADNDGDLDIVEVGAGTASVVVSAVVDYIDPANGERVVSGKTADPVSITVEPDATNTKLVASFTDRKDLPVVEAPEAAPEQNADLGNAADAIGTDALRADLGNAGNADLGAGKGADEFAKADGDIKTDANGNADFKADASKETVKETAKSAKDKEKESDKSKSK